MKFKQILLGVSFGLLVTYAQAQVKVGANPSSISTDAVLDVEGSSGNHSVVLQNGNLGVNTVQPGSTLTSAGSFAANYMNVTSATYAMAATDHFVSFDGSGAGTITLPPALAVGSGNFKGRLYTIKNTTTSQVLTVAANGSETIDGVTSLTVASEYAVQVISTGATSGKTWEVVSLSPTSNTKPMLGSSIVYTVLATAPVNVTSPGTGNYDNNNVNLSLSKAVIIPANSKALITVLYSVPIGLSSYTAGQTTPSVYLGIRFLRNTTEEVAGSRKFVIPASGRSGPGVVPMSTISGVYSEIVTSGASATTVTYDSRGYIEQNANPSNLAYRFNMWAASGDNFNWGKASMIITVTYF